MHVDLATLLFKRLIALPNVDLDMHISMYHVFVSAIKTCYTVLKNNKNTIVYISIIQGENNLSKILEDDDKHKSSGNTLF